jgi:hypothetical protein
MGNSPKDYHGVEAIGMCVGFLIAYGTCKGRLTHVVPDERHQIELGFTQNFCISIAFMGVLVALFSGSVMYLYARK